MHASTQMPKIIAARRERRRERGERRERERGERGERRERRGSRNMGGHNVQSQKQPPKAY